MTGTRATITRVTAVALLAVPIVTAVPQASAHTTKAQVRGAKAKLAQLNHQSDGLVEQYDQMRVRLGQTLSQLAQIKAVQTKAQAQASRYEAELEARAVDAYTGMGSQMNVLIGAQSFTQFSDRLQYLSAIAQSDSSLATKAADAAQRAAWAKQELANAVARQRSEQQALQAKVAQINQLIARQAQLYKRLHQSYERFKAAQRAAARQARLQQEQLQDEAAAAQAATTGSSTGGSGGPNPSGPPPPPNASAAQIAISAAKSVIGTAYVFGGASPGGFDCSGLTMWAYAHAGISMSHSSVIQYQEFPHVSSSDLQPGDLVFFYAGPEHVGLYIGGGMMIDANHTGGSVGIRPVYWSVFTGAARP